MSYIRFFSDPTTFAESQELIDEVRLVLELAFGLDEAGLADADFDKLADLSDIYLYKTFEGEMELEAE